MDGISLVVQKVFDVVVTPWPLLSRHLDRLSLPIVDKLDRSDDGVHHRNHSSYTRIHVSMTEGASQHPRQSRIQSWTPETPEKTKEQTVESAEPLSSQHSTEAWKHDRPESQRECAVCPERTRLRCLIVPTPYQPRNCFSATDLRSITLDCPLHHVVTLAARLPLAL